MVGRSMALVRRLVDGEFKGTDSSQEPYGPWDREEWDIALVPPRTNSANEDSGSIALYRIYRDLATGHWFADASYD